MVCIHNKHSKMPKLYEECGLRIPLTPFAFGEKEAELDQIKSTEDIQQLEVTRFLNFGCRKATLSDVPDGTTCTNGEIKDGKCVETKPVCCKAITKECLSCEQGKTEEEFCKDHSGKYGCKLECGDDEYKKNGKCEKVAKCTEDEYQVAEPSETSNRLCKKTKQCSSKEFEVTKPTATSDRQCKALKLCSVTEYETKVATKTSDRECKALTRCGTDQFETKGATKTSDRTCGQLTKCRADEVIVKKATKTSDRKCACPSDAFEFQNTCVKKGAPLKTNHGMYRSFYGNDWFGNTMPGYPKGRNLLQCAADCNARSEDACRKNPDMCAGGGMCKGFMVRGNSCWLKNSYWGAPNYSGFCPKDSQISDFTTCKSYINEKRQPIR